MAFLFLPMPSSEASFPTLSSQDMQLLMRNRYVPGCVHRQALALHNDQLIAAVGLQATMVDPVVACDGELYFKSPPSPETFMY